MTNADSTTFQGRLSRLISPLKYLLGFVILVYLLAYPQVLGVLRCDEAMTARQKDVPEKLQPFLSGMTKFRGQLLNVDTNTLIFTMYTSQDADFYFSSIERGLSNTLWKIEDGTGDARRYLLDSHGARHACSVAYFDGGVVMVYFAPYYAPESPD